MGDLLRYLHLDEEEEIEDEENLQQWLTEVFQTLPLPEEYLQGGEYFNPKDKQQWHDLQQSAKAHLFQSLLQSTGEKQS